MAPRVRSLYFYPGGTFDDQYNSGFAPGLRDRSIIDEFLDVTDDGRRLSTAAISNVASSIITLSSDVDRNRPVLIPGGWGEARCAFVMVVETDNYRDVNKFQVITGFTDRVDVSYRGTVAPDLELFVNNITELRQVDESRRRQNLIEDNSFIMRGQSEHLDRRQHGRRREGEDRSYYLRPSDVFYQLSAPAIANRYSGSLAAVSDHRSDPTSEFAKTRRAYNSPASFITDTIRAGISGRSRNNERLRQPGQRDDDVDYNKYMDEQDGDSAAADMLIPRDTGKNKVLSRLMEVSDFLRTGSVTFAELMDSLDFRDAEVVDAKFDGRVDDRDFEPGERGEGRTHYGSDLNTMGSRMAMAIVPALLITHGVGRASVTVTNDTATGRPDALVVGVGGLVPDLYIDANTITTIEELLKFDLANVLSNNGYYRFGLKMHYSSNGTTRVSIWIDERRSEDDFTYPTFTDCLTTPQITTDDSAVEDIARDVDSILETLQDISRERTSDAGSDRKNNY